MGTNYYARVDPCKCCNMSDTVFHIGKSSYGWTFSFHALNDYYYGEIKSAKEWFKFLNKRNVKIFDEYKEEVSLKELKELINLKKNEPNNHAKLYPENCFLDAEGNSFSGEEFC